MNRRLLIKKTTAFLAAVGLGAHARSDRVDPDEKKPPSSKTKIKITEVDLREHLYFDRDEVQWNISYDVVHSDGGVDHRVATQVGDRKLLTCKGLAIELDVS